MKSSRKKKKVTIGKGEELRRNKTENNRQSWVLPANLVLIHGITWIGLGSVFSPVLGMFLTDERGK